MSRAAPARRVQVLFLAALLGVLVVLGVVVGELAGRWAVLAYSVVVLVVLSVVGSRARAAQARPARLSAGGRSCTCCTTSQHDPVKVI